MAHDIYRLLLQELKMSLFWDITSQQQQEQFSEPWASEQPSFSYPRLGVKEEKPLAQPSNKRQGLISWPMESSFYAKLSPGI